MDRRTPESEGLGELPLSRVGESRSVLGGRGVMTPDEERLHSYLTQMAAMLHAGPLALKSRGYAYNSPIDFVLHHGRWYAPRPLPPDIPKGAPRACYGNAIIAAVLYDLIYVEGYAWLDMGGGGLCFDHAWCTDRAGRLFELTWPAVGVAYYGIEFCVARADEATWDGDACVLWDWRRKYPLLKDPWGGESLFQHWPESPRLEQLHMEKASRKEV